MNTDTHERRRRAAFTLMGVDFSERTAPSGGFRRESAAAAITYIEGTMAPDRIEAIIALLGRAEEAHGAYERAELGGVYDEDWPRWYARYAVDNGIEALLGHDVTSDDMAALLTSSNAEFQATEPKPTEPWAEYTARRIAAELYGR